MNRRQILFILWTIQGLAAFVWLAVLPGDNDHAILFGFSASRLILLGITLILTVASGYASLSWQALQLKPSLGIPSYILSILLMLAAPALYFILRALGETSGFVFSAYAQRLAPLLFWLTGSALEFSIFFNCTRPSATTSRNTPWFSHPIVRFTLYSSIFLAGVTAFIITTGIGITPSNDGSWGSPTTPLLEWQILLALVVAFAFLTLGSRWNWTQKDQLLFWAIYLFTCLLWLSQPIRPGFFATPPRAPNYEIYPFSDALIYAQYVQSALVGNGFIWPEVPTRPLYISFLTWLHAIAGQDYTHVIALQTIVLAFFPPILYLVGKELINRPVGLGLALLAGLRDLTANIAAPFALNYTYTKLFFSEIPAALLLCLFSLMTIRWMKRRTPLWYPFMAGGVLGLSSLIRLQSVVVLAAVVPIGFFVIKSRKQWFLGSALMTVGVALALLPWLARNYKATGGIVLDNPISQAMTLARRWSGDNGNELIPHLAGENDAQYSTRMSKMALASLLSDPGRILRSANNHFFNNEISNVLIFPLRDKLNSPDELIWPQHAFWQTWAGKPGTGQIPVIIFYLVLFGVGISAAWHLNGLIGLLPFAISLVYNAWTALFLSSGDRFLVPVDWAVYLYLFLGLFTLVSLLFRVKIQDIMAVIPAKPEPIPSAGLMPTSWLRIALVAAGILLIGTTVPLTEVVFLQKYLPVTVAEISPTEQISLHGRAIYPRWYKAGAGEPGTAKLGYGATDQARLVFFMVGEQNTLVIFQLKTAPKYFPNTAEIIVTGNPEAGYFQAQKITVQKDGSTLEYLP